MLDIRIYNWHFWNQLNFCMYKLSCSISNYLPRTILLFSWFPCFFKIFWCKNFSFFFSFQPIFNILCRFYAVFSLFLVISLSHSCVRLSSSGSTHQNSYSISYLLGTMTTQWLPLWQCSHCYLVPDTTEQWLHQTHVIRNPLPWGPM